MNDTPLQPGEVRDLTRPPLTEAEKFLSAVGYISFLCIIPLILKRDSNFAQFHGKQALLLAVFWYVVQLLLFFIWWLSFLQFFCIVACAYMAYQGKYFKIPVLGDYAEKLKF